MLKNVFTSGGDFPYLDSPAGLLTPKGYLFYTRESVLEAYAGKLLSEQPVGEWLRRATRCIESTDAAGVWSVLLFLSLLPLMWAIPAVLGVSILWHQSRTAFAGPAADAFLKVFTNEIVMLLAGVAVLSWLGISGEAGKAASGIALFLVYKFGWIRMLLSRMFEGDAYGNANLKADPPQPGSNDRILNMLLIRFGIKSGITLPSVEVMERDIMQAMQKSASQRKQWTKGHKK
ncbi:hypothetical protein [Cyclonatronum proteinivorum]|nr:hypothetical protein [Cyclonatronum proteinivorum]